MLTILSDECWQWKFMVYDKALSERLAYADKSKILVECSRKWKAEINGGNVDLDAGDDDDDEDEEDAKKKKTEATTAVMPIPIPGMPIIPGMIPPFPAMPGMPGMPPGIPMFPGKLSTPLHVVWKHLIINYHILLLGHVNMCSVLFHQTAPGIFWFSHFFE